MKILVALDDSANSMRAVEFVATNFNSENQITIFSVFLDTTMIIDYYGAGLSHSPVPDLQGLEEKRKEALNEAQEKAKALFVRAGFPEKNIRIKTQPKNRGVARDIIDEACSGYQIVALGRRGLSGISEFFLGSVSQKVLHGCKDASILLVV